MIYITGDTHGEIDFDRLKLYFNRKYISEKDYLIILGDAGIVWSEKTLSKTILEYQKLGITIFYIDGNHENFALLNSFPILKLNNAHVHAISDNIFHVLRGEILIINGVKFLCVGGAESIDKNTRIENINWWKDETLTEYQTNRAIYKACEYDLKIDYILSHAAPSTIHRKQLQYKESESTIQLDIIDKHIKYNKWYFGHYHIDKTFDNKFRCFYNDVLEISIMNSDKDLPYKKLYGSSIYKPYRQAPLLKNWETGKITKYTEETLPEWYYKNISYYPSYYCLKGVVDVAYCGSNFDNHISKDSSIYLSYDEKIKKSKNYSPIDKYKYISTWRVDIVKFTNGLEKYSPDLDLKKLKEKINLTFDQYSRNLSNHNNQVTIRPFPEIKTKTVKGTKYRVIENNNILCDFYDFETAKEYANLYIRKNLNMEQIRIIDNENEIEYDTHYDRMKWVKVVRVKYENSTKNDW